MKSQDLKNPLHAKTVKEFFHLLSLQKREPCANSDLILYTHLGLHGYVCKNCNHVSHPD